MPHPSTRALIIEKADALFYEGGFEATSFADIAAAVGISRGNFYHHFKAKDEILDAVISRRLDVRRAMLADWEAQGESPRERILAFVHLLIANREPIMAFGCPVGTLCSELTKRDHAAKPRAAEIFGLFRDWLTAQFEALGHADRAEALALHVLAWSQGVSVLASAFHDESFIRHEVAGIERWLEALPESPPES